MRFERLRIHAFGPFTDLDMPFPGDRPDLHVFYGPNEAGKSSLLRAVGDLFFGIPVQSPDNFLHDYRDLLLEAAVTGRDGRRLVFRRRKGNRNTLLDAAGEPLTDDALEPFLGPVDRAFFSAMFGLGADELREGARQLLEGRGNLGNSLFSASMGGTPVDQVLGLLEAEAERLFNGRATKNVSIRPLANLHKDLTRKIRDAAVPPERWEQLERELTKERAAKARLEGEIAALEGDLEWIARCEDSLPAVSALGEATARLGGLPALPDPGPDFVAEARSALASARETGIEARRLAGQLQALESELAGIQFSPAVLAEAEALDALHQDLGAYRERGESLARARETLAGLEPALRAGMANLGVDGDIPGLETLRLPAATRLACEEASAAFRKAETALEANRSKVSEAGGQLERLSASLGELSETDLGPLRDALETAAVASSSASSLGASRAEVARLRREADDLRGLLPGAPSDPDEAFRLPVPGAATIQRHRDAAADTDRKLKSARRNMETAETRLAGIESELARLQRRGELPTLESLCAARERRDRGWSMVLAEWRGQGSGKEFTPGKPLESAYPESVAEADGIADRLREEAESVAQAEEKRLQVSEWSAKAAEARQEVERLEAAAGVCLEAWAAEWAACGVMARSHDEMAEWREQWVAFRNALTKFREAGEGLEEKELQVGQAAARLAAALGDSAEKGFSTLYAAALAKVREGESDAGSRKVIAGQIAELRRDMASREAAVGELQAAVEAATAAWKARAAVAGLPGDVSPETGLELLRERVGLLGRFDKWLETRGAAESMAGKNLEYERAVEARARGLRLWKGEAAAQELEASLWAALTGARSAWTRHEQVSGRAELIRGELREATFLAGEADARLAELTGLAGVGGPAELEPLLGQLEERDELRRQVEQFRQTLANLARGQSIDEFVGRVRGEDAGSLPGRRNLAEGARAEKAGELESVLDRLRSLEGERAGLERAGDEAADLRQQAAACAAELRRDASRFVQLRLASRLLRNRIDSFRKANQGPMLARSGEFFSRVTRGSFTGLGAEFEDGDAPVIVAIRPDGAKVRVEGLSEGTRDQLFLALRLAALEQHVAGREPMPLILDDLLITFDNERALAILPELRSLSEKSQVLLFTHHEHLIELCRESLGEDGFHLHRLGTAPAEG